MHVAVALCSTCREFLDKSADKLEAYWKAMDIKDPSMDLEYVIILYMLKLGC